MLCESPPAPQRPDIDYASHIVTQAELNERAHVAMLFERIQYAIYTGQTGLVKILLHDLDELTRPRREFLQQTTTERL